MTGRHWAFPASFGQERTWLAEQQQAGTTVYTLPCHMQIDTRADAEQIVAGLAAIVQRHESLRTSMRMTGVNLEDDPVPDRLVEVPHGAQFAQLASDSRMTSRNSSPRVRL